MPFYVSPEQQMKDKADYARKGIARGRNSVVIQYDRADVNARGLANWYAQILGTIFTESNKPYEVEIVVAELGESAAGDQMYRITFDGSVADEHGYVAMGGQADQVSAVLKERYSDGMPLRAALAAALAALAGQGNGDASEINASQLEVAVLMRGRAHRSFRRLTGPRLDELLSAAGPAAAQDRAPSAPPDKPGTPPEAGPEPAGGDAP